MIEDAKHDVFAFDIATQRHPFGACSPTIFFAHFAFTGQVFSVYSGVIQSWNFGRNAVGVGEDFRFGGRLFQLTSDADAECAFFAVVEDYFFILCG